MVDEVGEVLGFAVARAVDADDSARARKYKRLEKEGGTLATEFVRLAPAAIPAMWQEFVDLEARSWRDLNAGTTVMHGSTGAQIARAVWERLGTRH